MQNEEQPERRKVIHIDMDAFYASVEQRDNPELRGKPVAVGGAAQRGVVAAASYEARRFGVRSAMASVTAKRLCPDLVFVRPRFDIYREISAQVRDIFERYTDLIEPLSLDEAYLDVTHDKPGVGSAIRIAELIRRAIRQETGLTASAGVSYNKFLAKVASDQNKPDGICVVLPGQGEDFVATLPARRFHGVGPKTAARMAEMGIHTGADLRGKSLVFLQEHFGKSALYLYRASRGRDDRPVNATRIRKSIGAERTWEQDLVRDEDLQLALDRITDLVWQRIAGHGARGHTLTLKVKYQDFQQITRARTLEEPIADRDTLEAVAREILNALLPVPKGVRLLGLALSGLREKPATPRSPEGVAEPAPRQYPLQF